MKKYSILVNFVLILLLSTNSLAQVAINPNGDNPDASAMLDVASTTKGMLIPRMTKTQRDDISNPETGLMVFQTDNTPGYYFYNSSSWGLIGDGGATDINGLSDGKTSGYSVFLGSGAGAVDDGTDNKNVAVGIDAFGSNTSGYYNTVVGYNVLSSNTTGFGNSAIGSNILTHNTTGDRNTAIGMDALYDNTTGYRNSAIGYSALANNTTGYNNIAVGMSTLNNNTTGNFSTASGNRSLLSNTTGSNNVGYGFESSFYNQTGSNNTVIGYQAGFGTFGQSPSGNVFLGYQAGFYETNSNKLYIENSNSSSPLIYGEFDNNLLKVNGELVIANGTSPGSLKFYEPSAYGTNFTKFQANSQSSDITYTLPVSDGTTGQVLQTNGSGALSWNNDGGATQINDLTDGKTGGNSVYLGSNAGVNDDGTDNRNVAVGIDALNANTTGFYNTAIGYEALKSNLTGFNTAIGYQSLRVNTSGIGNTANGYKSLMANTSGGGNTTNGSESLYSNTIGEYNTGCGSSVMISNISGNNNTAIGKDALRSNISGNDNTAMGYQSSYSNTTGNNNIVIGQGANYYNQEGSNNTIIGYQAGYGQSWSFHNKSGNVFLGYNAGMTELGDDKLYIENSNSTTPLIYGNFDTDVVTIYGNLGVGTWVFGNGTNTFSLINGTAPNASIADGILLYAEDVTSSELRVRDEAGNITTLSPHNFSITTKSEPMAWSYYSENAEIGKVINVDMLRAIRLIEKFTGEKLAFIEETGNEVVDDDSQEKAIGIIQQQQKEIDKLKMLNTELIDRIEKLENIITKR